MSTVTFETKCWEEDWEIILKTDYLKKQIEMCQYVFDKKYLFINNVKNITTVTKCAQSVKEKGIIDDYFIVDDYADEALKYYHIDIDSFLGGYYYSIAELVSIYLCDTDYLVHFSGDSRIEKKYRTSFIKKGIDILENNKQIAVVNPVWSYKYFSAKRESDEVKKDYYVGYGFSDQCYLIRTEEFKRQIYNEKNICSERYPKYGGELFEKRVDSYMRNNERKRATLKGVSYFSQNIRKNQDDLNYSFTRELRIRMKDFKNNIRNK